MKTFLAAAAVFALTFPAAAHAVPNPQTQEHMAEAQSGGLAYVQVAQAQNPRAQRGNARAQRQGAGAQRQGARAQRQGVQAQRQGARAQRQGVQAQRQGVRAQRQGAQGQGRARVNAQNNARPNVRPNAQANRPEPPRADRGAWREWTAQNNARPAPRNNAPAARPAVRNNPRAVTGPGPRNNPRANVRPGAQRGGLAARGAGAAGGAGGARAAGGDWRNDHHVAQPNLRGRGAFQTARPNFPRHRTFVYHGNHHPSLRVGIFHYPSGTSYRYWSRGEFLPRLFFTAQFFFTDYTWLGIDPPPPGYRWVRYGPDLLLVDIYTYEVVDVLYGVFYW